METGLITKGNAELGKALLEAATKQNQQAAQSVVLSRVQEIMRELHQQRDYVEQAKQNIAILEGRLKAIESGDFAIERNGVMSFSDPEISKQVLLNADCPSCGWPRQHRAMA